MAGTIREVLRCSFHRGAGVDGGGSFVGAEMGSAKPRVQFGPALEESDSATRHDGAVVAAGVGAMDCIVRTTRPTPSRVFRISTVLVAMLLLGAFVFLRQYVQDQALMALLQESRRGYDSQKRLQSELVQKEKLASLGNLVAGAAHDINHPLTAIMSYSEQLWAKERLTEEQNALVRKIVNQAQRTRDLVVDLLSFAQQSPTEKIPVDVSLLLTGPIQILESRRPSGKIRVDLSIDPDFPRVQGNANQLFQAFVEIIENAMDALEEAGGGTLEITAQRPG